MRSLTGLLEYEAWRLGRKERCSCPIRLTLFDLPTGAIVLFRTEEEVGETAYTSFYVHYKPINHMVRIFPGQRDCSFQVELAAGGRFRAEVRTKQGTHFIEYRIDRQQRRPVREAFSKLRVHIEDALRKAAPKRSAQPVPIAFSSTSLFADVSE